MSLYHYLVHLETVLRSRQDIEVSVLQVDVITIGAKFKAELGFHDGSHLSIVEQLERVDQQSFERAAYKYHYQDSQDNLIFRYDNSPHYPRLPTFPDHKHIGDTVVESQPPELTDILAEIDTIIYPDL